MNIVFKTSDKLIIGEITKIVAFYTYNGNYITIGFFSNNDSYEQINVKCDIDKVPDILNKINKDIKQEGICILDYL